MREAAGAADPTEAAVRAHGPMHGADFASRLHPSLAHLLEKKGWTDFTPAQRASLDVLLARRHALLLAPTGYGKTEAAVLPLLHHLLVERDRLHAAGKDWPSGFKALYITPLRALNRDLLRRLQEWCDALELRIGVRHGDTSQAERTRQARQPPDILITTPETLQLLLYGDALRRHLGTCRFVVVDEVHDLAQNERGAQLAVALERLEEVVGQPVRLREAKAPERVCPSKSHARPGGGFQRIGLSATVADDEAVASFLGGVGRDVTAVRVQETKELQMHVVAPEVLAEDEVAAAALATTPAAAAQLRTVRDVVACHERVIVFCNSREGAELLASRSTLLDEEAGRSAMLGLHHGSLSSDHRQDVEQRFRDGDLRGLVATSSLELGIDVGAIDHIVQVKSPHSVARLVQRLGRAGHRVGVVSAGTLVSSGPEDHLECVAVARMAARGLLEPMRIREAPLVVLANQLIAMSNEYRDLDPGWCQQVVSRAAPFAQLDPGLFEACWETLLDVRTLFESESAPGRMGRSGRARRHFLEHVSLIPDARMYRVVDEATKRSIGRVDDAYVAAALQPGQEFVMAGRSWRVLEIEPEAQRVRAAPSRELGNIPQWVGQPLPVSFELAQEVGRLRGEIAAAGSPAALAAELVPAAAPVLAQAQQLAVPTDKIVTLEAGRNTVVACVSLGSRGNDALGRITAALLHQRAGAAVGMECDAYRIHFTVPAGIGPAEVEEVWRTLDPESVDLLLAMVLREQPILRHHLVHVAKHFGAVPRDLDPNRFTRTAMDALWQRLALQEETLSRVVHDRFDADAVARFVAALDAGEVRVVHQALGPLSRLGGDEARSHIAPRADAQLVAAVRRRIESGDVLLVCTQCHNRTATTVAEVPRAVRCRRCASQLVACLRPWQEDQVTLLGKQKLAGEEKKQRERILRNGRLMASWGGVAARCLVARGVGPETATRILQKASDPADPAFWREILQAELDFARTHAHWS